MNVTAYYAPRQQFRRAFAVEWSLHGSQLLYGVLYVVIGFYAFRRVGYSQVYDVIYPHLFAAGLMVFLSRHIFLPSVKRTTAPYYFNQPLDRGIALDARLTFLFILAAWFSVIALVGSLFKLGGAGITACYRIHPDVVVIPFLTCAATVWHILRPHGKAHWAMVAALFVAFVAWLFWKVVATGTDRATESNNFWPEREMSLTAQFLIAGILVAITMWLIQIARFEWRQRQIGEIR